MGGAKIVELDGGFRGYFECLFGDVLVRAPLALSGGRTSDDRIAVASDAPTASATAASSPSTVPIGPIVGGVVGGLIGVAAILGFAWYMVARARLRALRHPGQRLGYDPPAYPLEPTENLTPSPTAKSPAVQNANVDASERDRRQRRFFQQESTNRAVEREIGEGEQMGIEENRAGSPRLRYPDPDAAVVSGNLSPERRSFIVG